MYGRFRQLRNDRWLIYGTQIVISGVWGAELQRLYLEHSGFGAIYKPLSETQTPESAIYKRDSPQKRPIRSRHRFSSRPAAPCNPIPDLFPPPDARHPAEPCTPHTASWLPVTNTITSGIHGPLPFPAVALEMKIQGTKSGRKCPKTRMVRQQIPCPSHPCLRPIPILTIRQNPAKSVRKWGCITAESTPSLSPPHPLP
ncbi:hypothetical protein G1C98_1329, partial [Bifidobacterium sp. DSM 109960]|nr:hypothetical protein [Bifidobacterium sp. DSM 109960]